MARDSFGAYDPSSLAPTTTPQPDELVGTSTPDEFKIRDFSGYPSDMVADYRLDTMLPSAASQRQVWESDAPEPAMDDGSEGY